MHSFPRRRWRRLVLGWIAGMSAAAGATGMQAHADQPPRLTGRLADGAIWAARRPAHWNGTLLLYSHGYSPRVDTPALAPGHLEEWLLGHGYALAASSYARGGWAVADAIGDDAATLATFTARLGRPRRTIAWGDSMGGLVTVALAEASKPAIDGAIAACGSIGGTVAMMNAALDGAFAFVTLVAPEAHIRLVDVTDDRANAERVARALAVAMRTPQGRARIALAGALGGLPPWTDPAVPQPEPADPEGQLAQLAGAVPQGLFLPRQDLQARAGGIFSWNTGIDYRRQLAASGREAWVRHFYRVAGLDLGRDLERLNNSPRIVASRPAVDYMRRYYAPTAAPRVPLFTLHTTGDGLTSESMQAGYAIQVARGPAAGLYRGAYVAAAGHCAFRPSEYAAALRTLEERLDTGRWSVTPAELNARARDSRLGAGRYRRHRPLALLRPCWGRLLHCGGEPGR